MVYQSNKHTLFYKVILFTLYLVNGLPLKRDVNSKLKSTLNCGNVPKFNSSFSSHNVSPSESKPTTLSLWLIIKCRFSAPGEQNREPVQIGH